MAWCTIHSISRACTQPWHPRHTGSNREATRAKSAGWCPSQMVAGRAGLHPSLWRGLPHLVACSEDAVPGMDPHSMPSGVGGHPTQLPEVRANTGQHSRLVFEPGGIWLNDIDLSMCRCLLRLGACSEDVQASIDCATDIYRTCAQPWHTTNRLLLLPVHTPTHVFNHCCPPGL
jgi:hypothetical protein